MTPSTVGHDTRGPAPRSSVEAVLIGASAGGMRALNTLLPALPADYPAPAVVVQHQHPSQDGFVVEYFDRLCPLTVKEAEDKEVLRAGFVYLAPPNYHLLIEPDLSFALSTDDKVNHSRPSIDVLFESAAAAYGSGAVGVMLTGASNDGAAGLAQIKAQGGIAVVQDPETAEYPLMPRSAAKAVLPDHLLPLEQIGPLLVRLAALRGPRTPGRSCP